MKDTVLDEPTFLEHNRLLTGTLDIRTTLGPWFSYLMRPINPLKENISSILEQLKEGTTFISQNGPKLISPEANANELFELKVDQIIHFLSKRRRNGEKWEYKCTNESRRFFIKRLLEFQMQDKKMS